MGNKDRVYIKFGMHHAKQADIVGVSAKNGEPAYYLRLPDGKVILKKQKNTIRMVEK